MDINEMTFGIEIECVLPLAAITANNIAVGGRHRGVQIPGFPAGWNAQHDGSINTQGGGVGVEVVSGVLKGAEGVRQVVEAVKKLQEWGATVNGSCGFHIHVGWQGQTDAALGRLVHIVANYEKAIFASTGTQNRERSSWCKSVKAGFRSLNFNRPLTQWGGAIGDRYHLLNVSNLVSLGGKPTVEFRAFAGTTNLTKILAYIRLCLGLVQKAATSSRTVTWNAPAVAENSPVKRDGEGQTELTRLFYALGWMKGRTDKTFGFVTADGAPDLDSSKRILMRLARKYDGVTRGAGNDPQ